MTDVPKLCRKSAVHVVDAKTMSPDPVAVIDLPGRVPSGFHAFFVTEVSVTIFIICHQKIFLKLDYDRDLMIQNCVSTIWYGIFPVFSVGESHLKYSLILHQEQLQEQAKP